MSDEHADVAAHTHERGATPPSAAGFLEPYGVRVVLYPTLQPLDAEPFLKALLESVASRGLSEGASVIGHLKCLLHAGPRRLRCNLTSIRSGATYHGDGAGSLSLDGGAELDLAVLAYGLPAATTDRVVSEALQSLLEPLGVAWAKEAPPHGLKEGRWSGAPAGR